MDLVSEIINKVGSASHDEGREDRRAECMQILRELLNDSDDIMAAMITTADGHPWAEVLPHGFDAKRFAAMSSALIALSSTLAREAQKGKTMNVLIEGMEGNIYVMHAGSMVLTIFTKIKPNLGLTLAHARRVADQIVLRARQAADAVGHTA